MNERIRVREVRVIGADGEQVGVMTRSEALELAASQELDLIEVSPMAEPPVCRIIDFGKFQFEQNKKSALAKKKQKQIQIKEVKFDALTEFARECPATDLQQLRACVREARKDRLAGRASRHYRDLFRLVRAALEARSSTYNPAP